MRPAQNKHALAHTHIHTQSGFHHTNTTVEWLRYENAHARAKASFTYTQYIIPVRGALSGHHTSQHVAATEPKSRTSHTHPFNSHSHHIHPFSHPHFPPSRIIYIVWPCANIWHSNNNTKQIGFEERALQTSRTSCPGFAWAAFVGSPDDAVGCDGMRVYVWICAVYTIYSLKSTPRSVARADLICFVRRTRLGSVHIGIRNMYIYLDILYPRHWGTVYMVFPKWWTTPSPSSGLNVWSTDRTIGKIMKNWFPIEAPNSKRIIIL